jgi:hypothetical protein
MSKKGKCARCSNRKNKVYYPYCSWECKKGRTKKIKLAPNDAAFIAKEAGRLMEDTEYQKMVVELRECCDPIQEEVIKERIRIRMTELIDYRGFLKGL